LKYGIIIFFVAFSLTGFFDPGFLPVETQIAPGINYTPLVDGIKLYNISEDFTRIRAFQICNFPNRVVLSLRTRSHFLWSLGKIAVDLKVGLRRSTDHFSIH